MPARSGPGFASPFSSITTLPLGRETAADIETSVRKRVRAFRGSAREPGVPFYVTDQGAWCRAAELPVLQGDWLDSGATEPGTQPAYGASRNGPYPGQRPCSRSSRVQRPAVTFHRHDPPEYGELVYSLVVRR